MKYLLVLLFLSACAIKPPNVPVCFTDAPGHANCAWTVTGADFQVDNVGHNYTQNNRNWTYSQLIQNSLIMPPDSYVAIKNFELDYCHQNSNACDYQAATQTADELEQRLQYKTDPE